MSNTAAKYRMQSVGYHGRFAPSPTGHLHVGSACTALVAWCAARHAGGLFTLRVEDLDVPRTVPGMKEIQINDLKWLGLDWDAGPDIRGPHEPYQQSLRQKYYQSALDRLYHQQMLFPCKLSRKDVQNLASAPHGHTAMYPRSLRPTDVRPGWYEEGGKEATIRLKVPDQRIKFFDQVCGLQEENVATTVGDYVLRRRDGVFSYQLAVVVDDLHMEITEVVRGQDLLGSTARQLLLVDALGGVRPSYAHSPLVLNAKGEKLSKRDESLSLAALRESGVPSRHLVGYLAWALGLLPEVRALSPIELLQYFDWSCMKGRSPCVLPENLAEVLTSNVTLGR
ncbi:MAG: tRNA glutamyl-Q(34) synthetase GluQRS [Rhodothermaceae bacterium]|nr:tRNA glutamyl-Q(34) synthetase GluQRS [Rhodothermaceae bacterium]MXZ57717.1 tRNA glutamyl-Q(34) synthetase GluQRS [Rhodothermaceae bacterium]MYB91768.1 tRNA glutamyl-Q(34) synthetase GluQRS [Rhodothermaceae bacterium]MYD68989.1 tRNA glutamyl-Q(34) synthetase GluQRS [Rhodothermaceae bacterium]MYG45575.1 tRNA glutamyl-Q(34) synthetase GluQRS [Rhodothermaceae bacterium]